MKFAPRNAVSCYRPQGKVRFSETFVCPREVGRETLLVRDPWTEIPQTEIPWTPPLDKDPPPSGQRPPVLTSSGGHCSGQVTSYWNAFLFMTCQEIKTPNLCVAASPR